jgi:hypothetical protein
MALAWVCPRCRRSFGRRNQPHSCAPVPDLDGWLADRPTWAQDVIAAVRDQVNALGEDVILEPVKGALMIKRARTFAELSVRADRVELEFILSRHVQDRRIARVLPLSSRRIVHEVNLHRPDDVDRQVTDWLTEAYESSSIG